MNKEKIIDKLKYSDIFKKDLDIIFEFQSDKNIEYFSLYEPIRFGESIKAIPLLTCKDELYIIEFKMAEYNKNEIDSIISTNFDIKLFLGFYKKSNEDSDFYLKYLKENYDIFYKDFLKFCCGKYQFLDLVFKQYSKVKGN